MSDLARPRAATLSQNCQQLTHLLEVIQGQLGARIEVLDRAGEARQASVLEALLFDGVEPCRGLLARLPPLEATLQTAA